MFGLICFGNIQWFFFAFGGITGCGSASLKLCVCDAAYPWSQSPSPNSQCLMYIFSFQKKKMCAIYFFWGGVLKEPRPWPEANALCRFQKKEYSPFYSFNGPFGIFGNKIYIFFKLTYRLGPISQLALGQQFCEKAENFCKPGKVNNWIQDIGYKVTGGINLALTGIVNP